MCGVRIVFTGNRVTQLGGKQILMQFGANSGERLNRIIFVLMGRERGDGMLYLVLGLMSLAITVALGSIRSELSSIAYHLKEIDWKLSKEYKSGMR